MLRTPLVLATLLSVNLAATPAVARDHDCQDDGHDGPDLRRLAEKVVAWRQAHLPPTADPSRWKKVQLLGINDFHGALSPRKLGTADVGGAAVLASYLKKATAENPAGTLIIHAGDHVGASPPNSALLQDEPSIAFLNLLGNAQCNYRFKLDPRCNLVGTPGNHELDEGKDEMLRLVRGGNHPKGPFLDNPWRGTNFPYVSANIVDAATGRPILPPFVIKWTSGVPIAVIGAVLEGTPTIVTPAGVAGLKFLDEADAINAYVPYIKALGVEAIVVTIHQGGFQRDTAAGGPSPINPVDAADIIDIVGRLDPEVDVVISGHRHAFTNTLIPNAGGHPVLVTQAFANGTAYADIDLEIDPATNEVMTKQAKVITTFHRSLAGEPVVLPDPAVAALVAAADAAVASTVSQVLGSAGSVISSKQNAAGESEMGNLIADAQRAKMGTDFALMNPGGVRADIDAGPITWGEVFAVQPFSNDLVTMRLTGQQLTAVLQQQFAVGRILQVSGLRFSWRDADGTGVGVGNGAVGGSLVEVTTTGGAPLAPLTVYSVTVNSFIAGGGDGFTTLLAGTDRFVGPVDLDAIVEYVKASPAGIDPSIEGRVTLVP